MKQMIYVWPIMIGISVSLVTGLLFYQLLRTHLYQTTSTHQMPLWFRVNRLVILWVTQLIKFFPSWRYRRSLEVKLYQAGHGQAVSALEFLAAQWVLCFYAFIVSFFLLQLIEASFWLSVAMMILAVCIGFWYPRLWLFEQARLRRQEIFKALPFVLDIVSLCVESGLNVQGALLQATQRCPPSLLRDELQLVLLDIRTGVSRADALRALAKRNNERSLKRWVSALIQAEAVGMSLGTVLKNQAEQCRVERFLYAEKKAMEAPVKMILPLSLCIFPCTFLVIGFPLLVKILEANVM